MKQKIDVFDYAGDICKAMKRGILLTTKNGEKVNTMTIGWGTIGVDWGKTVFIAFVRESRYTKQMLDENAEFTVNIPYGNVDAQILAFCGTKSGRDIDKITETNLTLEPPIEIDVPGIRELPLTLECKVLYRQKQDLSAIPDAILERYYPSNPECPYAGSDRDYHYAYYAEIVSAYLICD